MTHDVLVIAVFCHNTGSATRSTMNELITWAINSKVLNPKRLGIILINDGSNDDSTDKEIRSAILELREVLNPLFVDTINNSSRLGLAHSLAKSIELIPKITTTEECWLTQIPGNDQVPAQSLDQFIPTGHDYALEILYRSNPKARPLIKRIASKVLQIIVRNTIKFPSIEATANFLAPLSFYTKWLNKNSGHAYGVWLIAGALIDNVEIRQRGFQLKESYRNRHYSRRRLPKLRDIILMLIQLRKVRSFMRRSL